MIESLKYVGSKILNLEDISRITAVAIISTITVAVTTSTPFLFSELVNNQTSTEFLGIEFTISQIIYLYGASLGISKILKMLRKMILNPLINRVTYDTVYQFNETFMNQSHSYQITIPLGDKQERMVMARTATPDFTTLLLDNIIPSSLEMGACIGVLTHYYGWAIGSWVLGLVGFSMTYNVATAQFIQRAQTKFLKDRGASARYSVAQWSNFESIYYFNTLKLELDKLRESIETLQEANLDYLQIPERISLFHSLITHGILFGLIGYTGHEMLAGKYSSRDLAVIAYFAMQIISPLNSLGESAGKIRAASYELEPIIAFMKKETIELPKPPLYIEGKAVKIDFDRVAFYYNPEEPLLEDISFSASTGMTIALVGLSGGGKTTITRLLFRFYDALKGKITINEQDITEVDISSLRDSLSIVPQNPVLFNETLRYNIAYGAYSISGENVPDENIWDAIDRVGLHDFVKSLPEGLDKKVGERGLMLSGGQLLRVAIARAIIRNSPIIVLDEYTSALDPQTEQFIQKQLYSILKDKIKIIIAHRLTTIRDADSIIVLNNGKISEQGTFEELMTKNSSFKELWDKQQKGHLLPKNAALEKNDSSSEDEDEKNVSHYFKHRKERVLEDNGSLSSSSAFFKPQKTSKKDNKLTTIKLNSSSSDSSENTTSRSFKKEKSSLLKDTPTIYESMTVEHGDDVEDTSPPPTSSRECSIF